MVRVLPVGLSKLVVDHVAIFGVTLRIGLVDVATDVREVVVVAAAELEVRVRHVVVLLFLVLGSRLVFAALIGLATLLSEIGLVGRDVNSDRLTSALFYILVVLV